MGLLEAIPVGIAEWGAETFVAVIVLMILKGWLVPKERLTEKNEEVIIWRQAAQNEQVINGKLADSVRDFSDAAILKEEVRRALREQQAPKGDA